MEKLKLTSGRGVGSRAKQRGYSSIYLLLAGGVVGSAAVTALDWTNQLTRIDVARLHGESMRNLNNAVGSYMANYFDNIISVDVRANKDADNKCFESLYHFGSVKRAKSYGSTPDDVSDGRCKMEIKSDGKVIVVNNAFQPTLDDLVALGILDQNVAKSPILPTIQGTQVPIPHDNSNGGNAGAGADYAMGPAPNGYGIIIKPVCIADSDSSSGSSNCPATRKDLQSLLFNIHPFAVNDMSELIQAVGAAGANAGLSGPPDSVVDIKENRLNPDGVLRGLGLSWFHDNPVTQQWKISADTSYSRGADNIMAMRNGYGAAGWNQFMRRDGSVQPTADWDFGGKNLTNVGELGAKSIKVEGDISAKAITAKGDLTAEKNVVVKGSLKVDGQSTFGDTMNALGQLFVSGATELQSTLTVKGLAFFKDNATFEKDITVGGTADLNNLKVAGTADVTGLLTANKVKFSELRIGSTLIDKDGTFLGVGGDVKGVSENSSCGRDMALAQSTTGRLMICQSGAWTPIGASIQNTPPGSVECSPDGILSNNAGVLMICQKGKWVALNPGYVTRGAECLQDGLLGAAALTSGANGNGEFETLICRMVDGKLSWGGFSYARPKVRNNVTLGDKCGIDSEFGITSDNAAVICRDSKWVSVSAQSIPASTPASTPGIKGEWVEVLYLFLNSDCDICNSDWGPTLASTDEWLAEQVALDWAQVKVLKRDSIGTDYGSGFVAPYSLWFMEYGHKDQKYHTRVHIRWTALVENPKTFPPSFAFYGGCGAGNQYGGKLNGYGWLHIPNHFEGCDQSSEALSPGMKKYLEIKNGTQPK